MVEATQERTMFCYQCSQTPAGGCTRAGVCGKTSDVSSLMDTLIFGLKGMAAYAYHARELGKTDPEIDAFMEEALFATLTNVNFDLARDPRPGPEVRPDEPAGHGAARPGPRRALRRAVADAVSTGTQAGPGIVITGHDMLDLEELLKQTEGAASTSTRTARCCPPTRIRSSRSTSTWSATTAARGGPRRRSSTRGRAPSSPPPTASSSRSRPTRTACSPAASPPSPASSTSRTATSSRSSRPPSRRRRCRTKAGGTLTTGFHHTAILGIADKIVAAVKAGKIRHFFLVGGCDTPGSKRQLLPRVRPEPCRRTASSSRWPAASTASTTSTSGRSTAFRA